LGSIAEKEVVAPITTFVLVAVRAHWGHSWTTTIRLKPVICSGRFNHPNLLITAARAIGVEFPYLSLLESSGS